jgi:cell division protein FtsL
MSGGNRRRKGNSVSAVSFFSFFKREGVSPFSNTALNTQRTSRAPRTRVEQASLSYLVIFTLLSVLITGALIYHLHLRFDGVRLGYETSRARAERAQLVAEQRELRLELSSLKSPERVEAEAREKLGMEMPGNDRIIPIDRKAAPVVASGRAR